MDEPTVDPEEQSFDADLLAIDKIVAEAAASIDAGDYQSALLGFRQALNLARQFFGENIELTELEDTIADISEKLGD